MTDERPDVLSVGDADRLEAASAEYFRQRLDQLRSGRFRRRGESVFMAAVEALSWIGSVAAVATQLRESPGDQADVVIRLWLEQHEKKLERLRVALLGMLERFDSFGDEIDERIESEEYLALVRKAFRVWDDADTEEKRRYIVNLITNAGGGPRVTDDDKVRLFIEWIASYNEAHFAVIGEIYQRPRTTRLRIWRAVWGDVPRDNSAEADFFRLLIRDLSTGGVIRQVREVNARGQFLAESTRGRSRPTRGSEPRVIQSSFDDEDEYVLTELGSQFVHYTMNELVERIEGPRG